MLKPIKSILYRLLISRLMSPVRRLLIKIVNNSTELKHEAKLYSFEKLSRKDEFKIIKLTKQDMALLIDDFEALGATSAKKYSKGTKKGQKKSIESLTEIRITVDDAEGLTPMNIVEAEEEE